MNFLRTQPKNVWGSVIDIHGLCLGSVFRFRFVKHNLEIYLLAVLCKIVISPPLELLFCIER